MTRFGIRLLTRAALALVVLLAAGDLVSGSGRPGTSGRAPQRGQPAVVERIVDGDTIEVSVDEPGGPLPVGRLHRIRLLEVDTPEVRGPTECYGPEASAYTAGALPVGSVVHLVADRQDTDRYGRHLRYVWTDRGLFNEALVRDGYARAVLYEPNDRHIERLRAAEAQARRQRRGLWGACLHSRS